MSELLKFRKIDDAAIDDHYYLRGLGDPIYYMHEYTTGAGFAGENQIIANIKKNPATAKAIELQFKQREITQCAQKFAAALGPKFIEKVVLAPIPPSKAPEHAEYDDRMVKICRGISANADVRELVVQTESMQATHERSSGDRMTIAELINVYRINDALTVPVPTHIAVVDDVLTAGTHYAAMRQVLSERFPNANFVGLFVSRRVFPNADMDDF